MPCPCQECPQAPARGAASTSYIPRIERFPPLSVDGAGTRTSELYIGDDDPKRAAAWEVAIHVSLGTKDRLLGRLVARGWYQATVTHTYDGWDVNAGGRIFVPWPMFALSFIGALAGAGTASTVNVSALPWTPGSPALGHTSLYGRSLVSLAAGGTTSTAVPSGATHYRVAPNSGGTAGFAVEEAATASGGSEQAWDAYTLDPLASFSAGVSAPEGWRRVPPPLGTTVVRIVNLDGLNARKVAIHWRYDLGGLL